MIKRISNVDTVGRISFGTKTPLPSGNRHISIAGKGYAMQQVNSLKGVCKEILLRVANDKSLIAKTAAALGVVKLTETAITFFANENEGVRLSMPRGPQGELFKMQLLKDQKPENSIVVDSFGTLVESYGRESIEYMPEKKVDLDRTIATVAGIYNSVDDPLFNVRMFMRNAVNSSHIVANKLDNIKMPNIEELLKKQESESIKPTVKKRFMPTADVIKSLPKKGVEQGFSYRALIEQNREKEPVIEKRIAKPKKLVAKPSVEIAEKVKKVKEAKAAKVKIPAGVVAPEIQAKVIQAIDLFETVKAELKKFASVTALLARKNYNVQIGNIHHLIFEDIDVVAKSGKNYDNQRALSVKDNLTGESIKILDSGKVLENSKDISKLPTTRYFHYATQEKINDEAQQEKINRLLDKTISRLEDFKAYVDKKGWRKISNQVDVSPEAKIDCLNLERIEKIKEKYLSIKERLKKLKSLRASYIRKDFGLVPSKSSKYEFKNPNNDGYNYSIKSSKIKIGNFVILEKIKNDNAEEIYAIAPDGKIIKNTCVLSGSPIAIKYLTDEDFARDNVAEKVEHIINILERKVYEFENYVEQQTLPKKRGRRASIKDEAVKVVTIKEMVSINTVKEFLDKTVAEIQSSADKLRAITGFKSMLDSVAEDLRNKFKEFIQKNNG